MTKRVTIETEQGETEVEIIQEFKDLKRGDLLVVKVVHANVMESLSHAFSLLENKRRIPEGLGIIFVWDDDPPFVINQLSDEDLERNGLMRISNESRTK